MAEQQKFKVVLPSWMTEDDIDAAADDIIQFIIDRSAEGQGIRGNGRRYRFPGYTDAYKKKKGSSKVDLVLNDEMLAEIQTLQRDGHELTIGFEAGKQNDKAEGNQIGSYGRDPNPSKARRFLGINKEELAAVLARFRDD